MPFEPFKSDNPKCCPLRVSNNLKSGATVPKGNIFEGVRAITFPTKWDFNYIKQDDITKLKDLNELHTKPFGVVSYIYGVNPPSNMDHSITFEDFSKVDLRVGTIIEVNDFPEARNPAYQLTIDFGPLGIKKSSAQITTRYKKDELLHRQIVAVVNFPTKQIAKFMSECLVLGAVDGKDVILLNPEHQVKNGSVVS